MVFKDSQETEEKSRCLLVVITAARLHHMEGQGPQLASALKADNFITCEHEA